MITFEPVITLGPVIVWGTMIVIALILLGRMSRERRRSDRLEIKVELLEGHLARLEQLMLDGEIDDATGTR